ncbi:hypothetical protein ABT354_13260 [Streptomyces sp. NPDC000594]|uniref:hypothetical protein n=1 Tax=Streptomyces sp. NPDC000594 TaxID=3154261 RepID=UPI003333056B
MSRLLGREPFDAVHVQHLGFGLALAHVRSAERTLRLLHAGRLDANKSTVTAIDALAHITTHHTLTIGSGPELPALTARTRARPRRRRSPGPRPARPSRPPPRRRPPLPAGRPGRPRHPHDELSDDPALRQVLAGAPR